MFSEMRPRIKMENGLILPNIEFGRTKSRFGDGDIVDRFQDFLYEVMRFNRFEERVKNTIIINQKIFVGRDSVKTLPINNFANNLHTLYQRRTDYGRNGPADTILFQSADGKDKIVFEQPYGLLSGDSINRIKTKRIEFATRSQLYIESILNSIGYIQTDFINNDSK